MTQKVALITGGTRGIGAGIAHSLAKEGFAVAVSGLRPIEDVEPFLETLRAHGVPAIYLRADVSVTTEREAMLRDLEHAFGRLDVLVNNAGVAPKVRADMLEATEESFDHILSTNLKGPYFLTQSAAQWMIRQPEGRRTIINISSVSATVASINRGDYCISKAGIAMATRLWAVRLAPQGIDVYEVRPGIIATDMTSTVRGKYDALIEQGLLLEKRWGTPEDVGRVVAMLARGDLAYATGAVIELDGGLTLPRL